MHPAEISLVSVKPVNLIRLVPSEGKMHIWDSSRITLHLDGLQCDLFFICVTADEIACGSWWIF